MQYLKSSQPIPNQGMSHTYYEVEDSDTILRMMTVIPDQDQISLYPEPPVRKLFAPERCLPVESEEFARLWSSGEQNQKAT